MLKYKESLVEAIGKEFFLRKSFLENEIIETVYFGGGTPSILSEAELNLLLQKLNEAFDLSQVKEFTFEANPDDLSKDYVDVLRKSPVNRLSIGVQSFFDAHLLWMNRAHKGQEAIDAIKRAQDLGLENISIDLIYGTPGLSNAEWEDNLNRVFELGIKHVSSYCLTVEPKTALAKMIGKHEVADVNEEQAAFQFELLLNAMQQHGFDQYEISNFARPGHYAVHNTNYWMGKSYLGLGPGAHSFKPDTRSWNISNNQFYMEGINKNEPKRESEILSKADQFNEYVMTGLRTQWGCNRQVAEARFGAAFLSHLDHALKPEIDLGRVALIDNSYVLTREGKFFADGIASSAFILKH